MQAVYVWIVFFARLFHLSFCSLCERQYEYIQVKQNFGTSVESVASFWIYCVATDARIEAWDNELTKSANSNSKQQQLFKYAHPYKIQPTLDWFDCIIFLVANFF